MDRLQGQMQPLLGNGLPNVALERQWMLGPILHGEENGGC